MRLRRSMDSSYKEIARNENKTIIHAFDDPEVIAGQGSIGLELLEDLPDLDEIYIPVGGGGLICRSCNCYKIKKKRYQDNWSRI